MGLQVRAPPASAAVFVIAPLNGRHSGLTSKTTGVIALTPVFTCSGYVTSDTGAVEDIWQEKTGHHYTSTPEKGACAAIRDGQTDVCSGSTYHDYLLSGMNKGDCSRDDINLALQHTFALRMVRAAGRYTGCLSLPRMVLAAALGLLRRFYRPARVTARSSSTRPPTPPPSRDLQRLGLFDPIETQPYWHVGPETLNTTDSQNKAWLATISSMVLLKSDGKALPLLAGKKIAVIGPHANATSALAG